MEVNYVLERMPTPAQGPPPPGIPPRRGAGILRSEGYPHTPVPEQVSKHNVVSCTLPFQGLLSQPQTNC